MSASATCISTALFQMAGLWNRWNKHCTYSIAGHIPNFKGRIIDGIEALESHPSE